MKKISKKRLGVIILMLFIVVVVFYIYNEFNGNPISSYFAEKEYKDYIENNYGDRDFKVESVDYNFKFNTYIAQITSEQEGLSFYLEKGKDKFMYDQLKEEKILEDTELSIRFSKEIEEDLKGSLENTLNLNNDDVNGDNIFVVIQIPQGKYRDRDIKYSKEIDDSLIIEVSLGNINAYNYKNKLVKVASSFQEVLKDKNYTGLVGVVINSAFDNEEYCIILNKDDLNRTKDKLQELIYKGHGEYDKEMKNSKEIVVREYNKDK